MMPTMITPSEYDLLLNPPPKSLTPEEIEAKIDSAIRLAVAHRKPIRVQIPRHSMDDAVMMARKVGWRVSVDACRSMEPDAPDEMCLYRQ